MWVGAAAVVVVVLMVVVMGVFREHRSLLFGFVVCDDGLEFEYESLR